MRYTVGKNNTDKKDTVGKHWALDNLNEVIIVDTRAQSDMKDQIVDKKSDKKENNKDKEDGKSSSSDDEDEEVGNNNLNLQKKKDDIMKRMSFSVQKLMKCQIEIPNKIRGQVNLDEDEILLNASTDEIIYRWVRKPDVFNGYLGL